jgi:hypothetical protein
MWGDPEFGHESIPDTLNSMLGSTYMHTLAALANSASAKSLIFEYRVIFMVAHLKMLHIVT